MSLTFRVKILLYFPNFNLYEKFGLLPHQPSLALGYLAASLERSGISFEVLDACAEKLTHKQIIKAIARTQPEFIGITTNIAMIYAVTAQARLIRKSFPHIKIIMGGPWSCVEYQSILSKNIADVVVIGEGEHTLLDLLHTPEWNEVNLDKIKGIAFRSKKGVIVTQARELCMDLDQLGHPRWEKFPLRKYNIIHRVAPFFPVMLSRGCPYDCINCTKIVTGYMVRQRSIESIIQELYYLKRHFNCREVIVADDDFNVNLNWAKQVLHAISEHQKSFGFQVHLMSGIRADNVDEEFADLARSAGVYKTGMGVESGSQKVIDFLKKNLNLAKIPKSIEILHSRGILLNGYFMLGIPIETPNSLIYTVYYADRIGLDFAYFLKLLVIPGTKLYDYVRTNSKVFNDYMGRQAPNFHSTPLMFETEKLKPKDVAKAYRYALIRFYLNPRRISHFLKCLHPSELWYFLWHFFNISAKAIFKKVIRNR